MAEGAWVPAFDSIWKHRKTAALVRLTASIPMQRRHAVAGLFLELMAWARDSAESGDLGSVDPGDVAAAVGLPRARGVELVAALKASGLVTDDARAHVAGWEDGPGKLVRGRRDARERQRRRRDRMNDEQTVTRDKAAPSGQTPRYAERSGEPVTGTSRVTEGDVTRTSRARREESTESRTPYPPRVPRDAGQDVAAAGAELVKAAGLLGEVLRELRAGGMPLANIATWFSGAELTRGGRGIFTLVALNAFAADWITGHYLAQLRAALLKVAALSEEPRIVVRHVGQATSEPEAIDPTRGAA